MTKGLWGRDLGMPRSATEALPSSSVRPCRPGSEEWSDEPLRLIEEGVMRLAAYLTRIDRVALAIGFPTAAAGQDSAPAE